MEKNYRDVEIGATRGFIRGVPCNDGLAVRP